MRNSAVTRSLAVIGVLTVTFLGYDYYARWMRDQQLEQERQKTEVERQRAEKYKAQLQPIPLFTIQEAFGGWDKAYEEHFKDGANFDQIYVPNSKS